MKMEALFSAVFDKHNRVWYYTSYCLRLEHRIARDKQKHYKYKKDL